VKHEGTVSVTLLAAPGLQPVFKPLTRDAATNAFLMHGLADTARHVIQRLLNPGLHPMT
jgi:hypothetical protein